MDHPRDSAFEAFVIGALDERESAAFVAHASACDACATKLASEAQAELAVLEVHAASRSEIPKAKAAPHAKAAPAKVKSRLVMWSSAGALALAAAVLLFLFSGRGRREEAGNTSSKTTMTVSAPRATQPIPLVTCPDGLEQEKCVEDAHRHGLFVGYPPWASAPPLGGGRSGQGPSGSPFNPQSM